MSIDDSVAVYEIIDHLDGEAEIVTNTEALIYQSDEEDDVLTVEAEGVEYAESVQEEALLETENSEYHNLKGHTLLLHRPLDSDSGVDSYYCLQCSTSYNSVEDFNVDHGCGDIDGEVVGNPSDEAQWEEADEYAENVMMEEKQELSENADASEMEEEDVINPSDGAEVSVIDAEPLDNDGDSKKADGVDAASSEREEYYCNNCQRVFDTFKTAKDHNCPKGLQQPEEEKSRLDYACGHCPKIFKTVKALNSHMKMHKAKEGEVERPKERTQVSCSQCNTVFNSAKNLKLHMKIHSERRTKTIEEAIPKGLNGEYQDMDQFFCEICQKSFDQHLLQVHQNMHLNKKEFRCGVCNRQFENLSSYEVHMQLHGGNRYLERPTKERACMVGRKNVFPCQYCSKEFPRPHEKVRHERVHTGEKPYSCEVCGKTFRVMYSLTLHLRTHTNIRPFTCTICNKKFKSQPVFVHHQKTHQKERSYKCDICSKAFRTSVQLNSHRNCHTKPFNCTECNRPFSSLFAVKAHMKAHHKADNSNEPAKHNCPLCGAQYSRLFSLKEHLRDDHAEDGIEYELEDEDTVLLVTSDDMEFEETDISIESQEFEVDLDNEEHQEEEVPEEMVAEIVDQELEELDETRMATEQLSKENARMKVAQGERNRQMLQRGRRTGGTNADDWLSHKVLN